MTQATPQQRLRWLLGDVLISTPGLRALALVSTDGLPLVAVDEHCPVEELATFVAGINGLASGLTHLLQLGRLKRTVVTLDEGTIILMAVDRTACLAAYTSPDCDLSVVAFQMARLVDQAGHVLTAHVRTEVQEAIR
ncbi:roadblock/LC7 domain-containing protein [Streptacidiphilus fuscans]|uniref:Roadblock/LC7 domain-containing protein n=1 Tax=Streptacidiphilus fuscans TaxID=2789292 RepID=A0A931FDS7_9ACTN|nr:roadblock/LC7 domain-containing protein [Streptacidiphilus fuscans]MBF9066799.1 roadblock/LC7 domain-containing protein [Streptacidiphilus fuscans]